MIFYQVSFLMYVERELGLDLVKGWFGPGPEPEPAHSQQVGLLDQRV